MTQASPSQGSAPPGWGSIRDALVVARFQLARALRTRSAVSLCALFTLVSAGSAVGFTRILLVLEQQTARILQVPETDTPGTMLDAVKQDTDFLQMIEHMLGAPELVDWALQLPFLTLTNFWTGLGLVPFIAAAAGAEAISPSIQDRSLRFEVVRTGRLELVCGRFLGQSLLFAVAALCGAIGVWVVAMTAMTGNPPLGQITTLLALLPRHWLWALPFLGLGMACSQLTQNVNLSRLMAMGLTAASWVLWGLLEGRLGDDWPLARDLLLPLLPQSWGMQLWGPGLGWAVPGVVLLAMGFCGLLLGFPFFNRRNL